MSCLKANLNQGFFFFFFSFFSFFAYLHQHQDFPQKDMKFFIFKGSVSLSFRISHNPRQFLPYGLELPRPHTC